MRRQGIGRSGPAPLGTGEPLVEEGELLLDVEVAVERGVGVGELIVAGVRVEELVIGELRDVVGVAARDPAVGAAREELA